MELILSHSFTLYLFVKDRIFHYGNTELVEVQVGIQ